MLFLLVAAVFAVAALSGGDKKGSLPPPQGAPSTWPAWPEQVVSYLSPLKGQIVYRWTPDPGTPSQNVQSVNDSLVIGAADVHKPGPELAYAIFANAAVLANAVPPQPAAAYVLRQHAADVYGELGMSWA
jgi:hypothetical protein